MTLDLLENNRQVPTLSRFGRLHRALGNLLRKFVESARLRSQWRERRQAFKTLLTLDDRQLRDIGYTRVQVRDAATLPLSVNAALELQKLKSSKRH